MQNFDSFEIAILVFVGLVFSLLAAVSLLLTLSRVSNRRSRLPRHGNGQNKIHRPHEYSIG